jgi:hypothetical protein
MIEEGRRKQRRVAGVELVIGLSVANRHGNDTRKEKGDEYLILE